VAQLSKSDNPPQPNKTSVITEIVGRLCCADKVLLEDRSTAAGAAFAQEMALKYAARGSQQSSIMLSVACNVSEFGEC